MPFATNPILTGFNPDPSIIRVGDDYYIATSSFEWFPGIQIHHSTDLANWKLITRVLDRSSQLDLLGVTDSGGAWAPCLSYHGNTFYLVFSNVKNFDAVWKDTPNYLVTSKDINGPWSEPIFLSAGGFDGSLFHDGDKKWFLSLLIDHRKSKFFGGITIQEYDEGSQKLIGERKLLFEGTSLGLTEGPHLYKRGAYYYLVTAEGGTEYNHAVTIARSENIEGPYELHPNKHLVTCKDAIDHPLQKSGHGDFVVAASGQWFMVFLVARPLTQRGRCTLGRETAIEELVWEDDWPYLPRKTLLPRVEVPLPELKEMAPIEKTMFENFDQEQLSIHFQSLRVPISEDWVSLNTRPGYLRMYGRENPSSLHRQSLIARRVQDFNVEVSCELEFHPKHFQHLAGLICYYNSYHYIYLYQTANDLGQSVLAIKLMNKYKESDYPASEILLEANRSTELKVHFKKDLIQFYYKQGASAWSVIGPEFDASILSDDYVQDASNRYRAAFTGAFIGICVQDLEGHGHHADFNYFHYNPI